MAALSLSKLYNQ